MTPLDAILDGLEEALALERELGVRVVEMNEPLPRPSAAAKAPRAVAEACPLPEVRPVSEAHPVPEVRPRPGSARRKDFIFLHDRPLSPTGAEMVSKIVRAMGKTEAEAPVVVDPPLPPAKVYIVLGGLAMRKFFPEVKGGAPGKWIRSKAGQDVLVTNSPEYILRFKEVTPAVRKIKEDMWRSLKTVLQRIRQ